MQHRMQVPVTGNPTLNMYSFLTTYDESITVPRIGEDNLIKSNPHSSVVSKEQLVVNTKAKAQFEVSSSSAYMMC